MPEFKNFPFNNLDGSDNGLMTIASGPVIIENNQVLLVQHGEEKLWKFPGGKCHDNESFIETAVREVREEVGLDVSILSDPYVLTFSKEKNGKSILVVLIHYLAKRLNDTIKLSDEIDKYDWFSVNDLPADSQPNVVPVVKHFTQDVPGQTSR